MSDQFDIGGLLEQAQAMQQRMMDVAAEVQETEVEGESGGGAVKITVNGGLLFKSVRIDPKAVDPDDVELLEDLVLAAINDAMRKASDMTQEAMQEARGGIDLSQFGIEGLPGMGGMPGMGGGMPGLSS